VGSDEAAVRGVHLLRSDERELRLLSCTYSGLMRMHTVTVAAAGDSATLEETASWQVSTHASCLCTTHRCTMHHASLCRTRH
jgi:hypothetical protein